MKFHLHSIFNRNQISIVDEGKKFIPEKIILLKNFILNRFDNQITHIHYETSDRIHKSFSWDNPDISENKSMTELIDNLNALYPMCTPMGNVMNFYLIKCIECRIIPEIEILDNRKNMKIIIVVQMYPDSTDVRNFIANDVVEKVLNRIKANQYSIKSKTEFKSDCCRVILKHKKEDWELELEDLDLWRNESIEDFLENNSEEPEPSNTEKMMSPSENNVPGTSKSLKWKKNLKMKYEDKENVRPESEDDVGSKENFETDIPTTPGSANEMPCEDSQITQGK